MYQSGWLPAEAEAASAGPYSQIGLIVIVRAMIMITATVAANRRPNRAAAVGNSATSTGAGPIRRRSENRAGGSRSQDRSSPPSTITSRARTSQMWIGYRTSSTRPGNSLPKSRAETRVPITGMPRTIPSKIRSPVPDSESSGSAYPLQPPSIATTNRPKTSSQRSRRGRRNAPRKNMINSCIDSAAGSSSADQWCACRMMIPPGRSNEIIIVVWNALDTSTPFSGL